MNNNGKHTANPAKLEITQLNLAPCRKPAGRASSAIVVYNPGEAKTKLVSAKVTDEIVAAILALGPTKPPVMSALVDLACSDHTAKEIAKRYAFKPSALHYWGKRIGLPMRQRGRRALLEPTPKHARILEFVRAHGITDAARRVGISRQRAHAIVCRWEPALRGRRAVVKLAVLPRAERRPPRNIVVSFRISAGDWERLLAAAPVDGEGKVSGFAKARAIVLSHLATPSGDEPGPAKAIVDPAGSNAEILNVYNQKAA